MKEIKYTCDKCKQPIGDDYQVPGCKIVGGGTVRMAGGGELCTLSYQGIMGHNGFSKDKHYHYQCFCEIVELLK